MKKRENLNDLRKGTGGSGGVPVGMMRRMVAAQSHSGSSGATNIPSSSRLPSSSSFPSPDPMPAAPPRVAATGGRGFSSEEDKILERHVQQTMKAEAAVHKLPGMPEVPLRGMKRPAKSPAGSTQVYDAGGSRILSTTSAAKKKKTGVEPAWKKHAGLRDVASGIGGGGSYPSRHTQTFEARPAIEKLNREQKGVLDRCLKGESLFLTGAAGTGKSFLTQCILWSLRRQHIGIGEVAATASTGVAAFPIGGQTLHSFAGIGLGKTAQAAISAVMHRFSSVKRWQNARVLLIDEISMVDGELLDVLDQVARTARKVQLPMGGLQVIAVGDFFQLPPVHCVKYAFESHVWKELFGAQHKGVCILQTVFRQSDEEFVRVLNEIREGKPSESALQVLRKCEQPFETRGFHVNSAFRSLAPTKLFPHRATVLAENMQRLAELPAEPREYLAEDRVHEKDMAEVLDRLSPVPATVVLKEGAEVILVKNQSVESGLFNGARGKVLRFVWDSPAPDGGPTGGGSAVAGFGGKKAAEEAAAPLGPKRWYPEVQFASGECVVIKEEEFSVERSDPEKKTVQRAARRQIPLLLAWAFSVHKSQGMSIDKLVVNLEGVWECGQAYVALSRARSLDGLLVANLRPSGIRSDPRVSEFYDQLKK